MLDTAMIGLGWWGKELVRSARDSKLMRFTRGVTLEPETVRDFAKEMNITIGMSYEDVLGDNSIDAVVLATPHTRHRAQVEAAAGAGKHVFCEKPFALTVEDAEAAIAACRKAGVALGIGHNRRLWPSIVKLKEVVSSPEFGTVMFAEGNYSHDILANTPLDNWRSAPSCWRRRIRGTGSRSRRPLPPASMCSARSRSRSRSRMRRPRSRRAARQASRSGWGITGGSGHR